MGARERTGTSECQVSEAPGQFSSRLLDPLPAARVAQLRRRMPSWVWTGSPYPTTRFPTTYAATADVNVLSADSRNGNPIELQA